VRSTLVPETFDVMYLYSVGACNLILCDAGVDVAIVKFDNESVVIVAYEDMDAELT
jgi:hypothetical protein